MEPTAPGPPLGAEAGPDPLPPSALGSVLWEHGERLLCSWRTPQGFLAVTDLRCLGIWQHTELFRESEWREGPSFRWEEIEEPCVVLGRFVELRSDASIARFLVRDPEPVRVTIEHLRALGRRQAQSRQWSALGSAPVAPRSTVLDPLTSAAARVLCRFCGRPMDAGAARCPECAGPALG
jgi:hypothetical protein